MAQFKSIVLIAGIGLFILFSGCTGKQEGTPTPTPTVSAIPVVTETPIAAVTTPQYSSPNASDNISIANSINNFTFKTYSLLSNESGNLFFSPFSISTALSMAAEGAGGKTLEEMRNILELSNDSSANRKGFESLLSSLNARNASYNLSIADAIWIEKTFSVKQEFSNVLSTYYHALAQQADFINNPDGERTSTVGWRVKLITKFLT